MSDSPTPKPRRQDFRLLQRQRVRWSEVDLQQVVFNGHYLAYFDNAVNAMWRAMAAPYQATVAALGGDFYMRKSSLDYLAPARFDEVLELGVRLQRLGRSSMLLQGSVFRGEQLLVQAELLYVWAQRASPQAIAQPQPIPEALRGLFQAFEQGEAMVQVSVGDWARLGPEAGTLRHQVFVQEQRIPAELEWDAADASVHALARNRLGLALATGRLLQHAPGVARLGRMAVLAPLRGSGVGRQVLEALLEQARARGDREAMLHAQASAVAFYLRAGFTPRGPVFEEAGIAHQEMVLAL
jgi:YbgC/YbaW family acyl-CoA thioester hydrolase